MEALAAIAGLDVLFLGPFDFAIAAGIPGAGFDHPVMAEAIERMVAIAGRHGKYVMTSVGDRLGAALERSLLDKGVRMISYSADALVFRRACQEVARLKLPVDVRRTGRRSGLARSRAPSRGLRTGAVSAAPPEPERILSLRPATPRDLARPMPRRSSRRRVSAAVRGARVPPLPRLR